MDFLAQATPLSACACTPTAERLHASFVPDMHYLFVNLASLADASKLRTVP